MKHDFAQTVKEKVYAEIRQSGPELTKSSQAVTAAQVACSNSLLQIRFFKVLIIQKFLDILTLFKIKCEKKFLINFFTKTIQFQNK